MSKMCNKCLHYYDDNLDDCPYCNTTYNIKNPFLSVGQEKKNNVKEDSLKVEEKTNVNENFMKFDTMKEINEVKKINVKEESNKNSIIFMDAKIDEEKKEVVKETVKTNKKKASNKKEKINFYSCLALVLSLILLFITVYAAIISFNMIMFIHYAITSFLLILSYRFSLNSKTGYYIGIIASFSMILMIIEKDYTNFIVGIYMFFSSFVNLIKK